MFYFTKLFNLVLFLLTVITFSIVLNFSFISDSHSYNVCATAAAGTQYGNGDDAEGAILVKDEGDGDITSFALASSPTSFTFGGQEQSCDITPDHYKITIYKIGLCLNNPFKEDDDSNGEHNNTVGPALESCVTIFNNDDGKEVDIEPTGSVPLLDQAFVIPMGEYKYPYVILNNHIHLKHIQKFINHDDSNAAIKGYHASSEDKFTNRGTVCYTGKDNSGNIWVNTHTFELQAGSADPAYTTLHGTTLPTQFTGTPTKTRYRCGTLAEANAGNDWTTTIINSFGNRLWQSTSSVDTTNFRNYTGCCNSNAEVPGITQFFYLLKNDNLTIADTQENARRIFVGQIHDTPTKITEETIAFKLRFKTNNAINVRIYQEEDSGGENRDELLMGTRMMANEIYLNIQTKERRTRGRWR